MHAVTTLDGYTPKYTTIFKEGIKGKKRTKSFYVVLMSCVGAVSYSSYFFTKVGERMRYIGDDR